ncbi:MAG: exodeoxyribonuclease VII large subunit [Chloracidobacterium sp.]|uniref:Exodeoxyribonuclease 7 large subunit n=1 Tax=Chloracidobacterium validum TaxID=2821543 RepID=A0ABX8BCM9_9BACT|nr:exodeoxyribonuclease VII large subunit [Chloracidobacterium validum]QUW03565.1 exodeoxyribonuclease VII large subunit [Chloracidobacterium validum]
MQNVLEPPPPLTVSALTAQIRRQLEREFGEVTVEGELSNFVAHTSGHWYFTLKDAQAQIRCACWKGTNYRIRFRPQNGQHVVCRGRITVYAPKGEYQLTVEAMSPVGVGAQQMAFEQLKAKLNLEGLFAPERKRPLPLIPRRIGIVTSSTGAALHDILNVLRRRNDGVSVLLYPAPVEGVEAAPHIAAGVRWFSEHNDSGFPVDVLIVGRGGGSAESLWAFNTEEVARAIAASRIPVISAVGHEIDVTIADFVADLRAPTPSAAAEMVAARRGDVLAHVNARASALAKSMRIRWLQARNRTESLAHHPAFADTQARLRDTVQQCDELTLALQLAIQGKLRLASSRLEQHAGRLHRYPWETTLQVSRQVVDRQVGALVNAARLRMTREQHRLGRALARLEALSPLRVLARGYAVAQHPDGRIVRSVDDVQPGQPLRIRLADGYLHGRVESVGSLPDAEDAPLRP